MKVYFEIYNPEKTYLSYADEAFTPEHVQTHYATVNFGTCIVQTDKSHVRFGYINLLSDERDRWDIDDSLTDEEAVAEIERLANLPAPEPEPTAEERMAAALEFQNILAMPLE